MKELLVLLALMIASCERDYPTCEIHTREGYVTYDADCSVRCADRAYLHAKKLSCWSTSE